MIYYYYYRNYYNNIIIYKTYGNIKNHMVTKIFI